MLGTAIAAGVWLLMARTIWVEYRADAQVRRDAASIREFERAREVLR